jgi:hypothetical protein
LRFQKQGIEPINNIVAIRAGKSQDVVMDRHVRVSFAIARLEVSPGDSIPNKFTSPGIPCVEGPAIMKSAAASWGPEILGRIPE